MAKKQRKKRNKRYKPTFKSDRKDYRKGGRVALREGTPIGGVSIPPKQGKVGNYGPTSDGTQRGITPITTGTVFGEENLLQPPIGGAAAANREGTNEADPPYVNPYTPPAPSYETGGEDDPNREDRVVRTGFRAEDMAQGILPEDVPQIDEPEKIGRAGTEITPDDPRYFMQGVEDARAGTVATGSEDVSTERSREADIQGIEREATQMEPVARTSDVMVRGQETRARGIDESLRGQVTDVRDSASIAREQAELDRATTISGALSAGAFADQVSNKYSNATLAPTPDAERQNREAIVDRNAVGRDAAQILGTINYDAAQRRTVTGQAPIGAAATMIAEVAEIPEPLAAAIVESPASVEAQIDNQPVEVQAAVASLPLEATISGQMELLMGSLEEGEVPQWARPAVDAVERNLANRGLTVSTIGRDSLFNAIIQSAMPIAQADAQALQQRAAQNLSNQQQANLASSQNAQQLKMANLSNRQTAASQSAQFAQQMAGMQSQFNQQAVMQTANMQQQTAMANLQARQQAAMVNAANQQAINVQNLKNEQQIELANLQVEAQAAGADQSAENQARLVEMQTAATFMSQNAAFKQDMDKANLSADQQIRLANLSALNQAESEQLSANQQTELANLNKRMQVNLNNANLAQQMGLAQLNVDQQRAMQHAQVAAGMDMANFSNEQQVELANSKFMQTTTMANLNNEQQSIIQEATALASMDLANLSTAASLRVESAKNFLSYDMANLNNKQQATILKAQQQQQSMLTDVAAENARKQFNATSENQRDQFMMQLASQFELSNQAQTNNMRQFNATAENAAQARASANELAANSLMAQLNTDVSKFNAEKEFQKNQLNTQQATVIAQSNVEWRRKSNTADTAAFNAVNQQNAMNAFNLTASANNFLWQELRDEAAFDVQRWDNDQQRKASMLIAALGNDQGVNKKDHWDNNINTLANLFDGWLS